MRVILRTALPQGAKTSIADILGCRKERISRELHGIEKLSEEVIEVALGLLELDDSLEATVAVERIRDLRSSSIRPVTMHVRGITVEKDAHGDLRVEIRK